jgi:Transposase DDE domain group 1
VKRSVVYPQPCHDTNATRVVGHAGGMLLTRTAMVSGLAAGLSGALSRWRKPLAVHDPGKIVCDLALSLALGGDCLADAAVLRAEPAVFGRVASDPTISRLVSALAGDAPRVLAAIDAARAEARARVWRLAGDRAPDHGVSVTDPLVLDVDATLVTAHSDKENARPTFKKGYGFHPLCVFVDHGPAGTGSRWRSCYGRATPARTPLPTTSACCARRSHSCPAYETPARARRCWSASMVLAIPTS